MCAGCGLMEAFQRVQCGLGEAFQCAQCGGHTHACAHGCAVLQVASLAPKVEAMEASWNRIRTISGAETAEDVIMYWEGLKAKEEQVRKCVLVPTCAGWGWRPRRRCRCMHKHVGAGASVRVGRYGRVGHVVVTLWEEGVSALAKCVIEQCEGHACGRACPLWACVCSRSNAYGLPACGGCARPAAAAAAAPSFSRRQPARAHAAPALHADARASQDCGAAGGSCKGHHRQAP